mmetsp:Transcript_2777/g.4758  ORF Transcript_2777/g.4758 Transcript_2777/m.4758 type:complete len:201 (-) Transcript_2777:456-1058(-)
MLRRPERRCRQEVCTQPVVRPRDRLRDHCRSLRCRCCLGWLLQPSSSPWHRHLKRMDGSSLWSCLRAVPTSWGDLGRFPVQGCAALRVQRRRGLHLLEVEIVQRIHWHFHAGVHRWLERAWQVASRRILHCCIAHVHGLCSWRRLRRALQPSGHGCHFVQWGYREGKGVGILLLHFGAATGRYSCCLQLRICLSCRILQT